MVYQFSYQFSDISLKIGYYLKLTVLAILIGAVNHQSSGTKPKVILVVLYPSRYSHKMVGLHPRKFVG